MRQSVISSIDLSKDLSDESICDVIDDKILSYSSDSYLPLKERVSLRRRIMNSLRGFDVLQELLDDPSVTEIMVNGFENIFVERDGQIVRTDLVFSSVEQLSNIVQQIVAYSNRRVNESNPIVDARLKDGSRVNIVLNPVAINGPIITIRKFSGTPMSIERLIELNSVTREAADFLQKLVVSGYNIFVSGGTSSGKTTFLNILSDFIPKRERVITIEDSAELNLHGIDNLVRLEMRQANVEGFGEISIRDLIHSALRMRPDRLVIGEVRGAEAIDMLQAMNTGHDGCMSTGHANSAGDMLNRLATMSLSAMDIPLNAIKGQIASAIDIIIHLGRMNDRTRRVLEIAEIDHFNGQDIILNPLFAYSSGNGLMPTGRGLIHTVKLNRNGFDNI